MSNNKYPFNFTDLRQYIIGTGDPLDIFVNICKIKKIYQEYYELKTDNDVLRYFRKYKVDINNLKDNISFFYLCSKKDELLDKCKDSKYNDKKFRGITYRITYLLSEVEKRYKEYEKSGYIFKDKDYLIFEKKQITEKLKSLKNVTDSYSWINKYYWKLHYLSKFGNNYYYKKLYEINRQLARFHAVVNNNDSQLSNYNVFTKHIRFILIPFVTRLHNKYYLQYRINYAKQHYPDDFFDSLDKYPIFNLDYNDIKIYSQKALKNNNYIADYYIYIIDYFLNHPNLGTSKILNFKKSLPVIYRDLKIIYKGISKERKKNIYNIHYDTLKVSKLLLKINRYIEKLGSNDKINSLINEKLAEITNDKKIMPVVNKNTVKVKEKLTSRQIYASGKKTHEIVKSRDVVKSSDKIIWLGSDNQLKKLLYQLQDNDFIENYIDEDNDNSRYLKLFTNRYHEDYIPEKASKVIWKQGTSDLAYLVGELTRKGSVILLDGTKKWASTAKVFLDRNKKSISPDTLNSSYHKDTNTREQDILNKVINSVRKSN